MGNSRKQTEPIRGQVREMKPLTPEERQEQAARAYMQKRESIATGVLFNLMHNPYLFSGDASTSDIGAEEVTDFAIQVADKLIEKLYFTSKEDKE